MHILRICVPFVFVLTVTSGNLFDLYNKSNFNNLTADLFLKSAIDCTTLITKKYMPCGTLINLISTISYMDPLTKVLSDKNCYNFIIRSFETQEWLIWSDFYITSLNNISQFYSSFKNLTRDTAWNPKAQFIILIYELQITERDDVFNFLMTLNIFNVLVMTKSENDELQMNTYNPFDNNTCGRSFETVININNCEDIDTIKTNYTNLESQFDNCTIDIAGIENVPNFIYESNKEYSFLRKHTYGLEQYMLFNMAKRQNITLKYILAEPGVSYGIILPNWTVTGLLEYLDNNTVDIVAGGLLFLVNRMKLFECIWGYNYASFSIYTPALGEVNWKKVYQQFSASTWVLIALSYCSVTIIATYIGQYYIGLTGKVHLTLKLWGYIFGNTNAKLVRIQKLRIVMVAWIWFTFFITSFYSTAFYSLLTTKSNNKLTFLNKTLDSVPFKPCISDKTRLFFKYRFNESLPGESTSNCKSTNLALDTVANSVEFYALERDYMYKIREFKYIDDKGNYKLDGFRYTNDIMFSLHTRRGFPLLEKFQRYTHYHVEAGLLKNHAEVIRHQYNIYNKPVSHTYSVFGLTDFRIHYGILFLGYIISLMCFIFEIQS